ncbi:DDE-type integrase/transposase/recombinase, partial [Aduncisulcus paluster]
DGSQYITVFVDNFSRFVEMIPSKSTTAEEAKQALLEVIGGHGVPKSVRTDGGSQFTSHLWYELMSELGVKHIVTTPDHHQENGQVERVNREILRQLRLHFAAGFPKTDWVKLVPIIMATLNSRVSERLGRSPMEILY